MGLQVRPAVIAKRVLIAGIGTILATFVSFATVFATSGEKKYVVFSKSKRTISSIAEENAISNILAEKEMMDNGVTVISVGPRKARQLKQQDIIIEDDILFTGFSQLSNDISDMPVMFYDSSDEESSESLQDDEQEEVESPEENRENIVETLEEKTTEENESETKTMGEEEEDPAPEDNEESGYTETEDLDEPVETEKETTEETAGEETETEITGGQEKSSASEEEEKPESNSGKEYMDAAFEWNLASMRADRHADDPASKPVRIAILDSGVNYREDTPVFKSANTKVKDGLSAGAYMFEDGTGHGTGNASLIVSRTGYNGIQGANEDAIIYSVKVLDDKDKGGLVNVVQGIYWAIDQDVDIICMSFGTPKYSQILHEAVKDAAKNNILMIAAAGNGGGTKTYYPAAYDEVISVGATTMDGEIASDSVHGSEVEIYAPGQDIPVNSPYLGVQFSSGTSLAAAEVAAAASVVWEKMPGKKASYIRGLLRDTANHRLADNEPGGLVDVEAALEMCNSYNADYADTIDEEEVSPIPVFEENEVRALWGNKDHRNLVTNANISEGYVVMHAASQYPDRKTTFTGSVNTLSKVRPFHGAFEYKKTVEFMVDLANAYYSRGKDTTTGKYKKDIIWDEAKNDAYLAQKIDATKSYSIYSALHDYVFDYSALQGYSSVANANINERNWKTIAYKIMGVVTHTVGDTYAHRTIVTSKMVNDETNFIRSDFGNNFYELRADVAAFETASESEKYQTVNPVEFRDVSDYTDLSDCVTEKDIEDARENNAEQYEDNIDKIEERYNRAKVVVNRLIAGRDNDQYDFKTDNRIKDPYFQQSTLSRRTNR